MAKTEGSQGEEEVLRARDVSGAGLWKLERDDRLGRYLTATRDIAAGEVILEEAPVAWGPNSGNRVTVCLACFRHIPDGAAVSCSSCHLPLCSSCSSSPSPTSLHSTLECGHFAAKKGGWRGGGGVEDVPYGSLLALRLLLLRDLQPATYSHLLLLASLLPEWRATKGWLEGHQPTVALIREELGMQQFAEEEILEVLAILSTNAFSKFLEPRASGGEVVGTQIRVVYVLAAMMAHSCLPNAEQAIHSIEEGLRIQLRATLAIPAGTSITISYTELLAPTAIRQFELLNSKLFVCCCPRCADPRELGSLAQGVKCSACLRAGAAVPGTLLPGETPDLWRCDRCPAALPAAKVLTLVFKIYEQMEAVMVEAQTGPAELEAFLSKYGRVLGEGHGLLQRVRYSLCGQYGRLPGFHLQHLTPKQLERKVSLCQYMLKTLDLLQPGRTSRRAMVLYELHIGLLVTGRALGDASVLRRCLCCLEEAVDLLADEPADSFGGQLYRGGAESLPQVRAFVNSFK